jgi:hypothetical protein
MIMDKICHFSLFYHRIYRKSFSWLLEEMIPGMMGRKHKQGLGGVLGFIKSMYLGDNPLLVNQHVGLFVWQPHGGSLAPLLHEQT